MTKGQRAMAVAMLYPEPAKVRRKGSGGSKIEGLASGYVSNARTVLRTTPEVAALVLACDKSLAEAYREAQSFQAASQTAPTQLVAGNRRAGSALLTAVESRQ